MKKLCKLGFIGLVFILNNVAVSFSHAEDNSTKKCEKKCVRYEERKDCQPDPVFPERKICASYKVCVEYEEICKDDYTGGNK